MTSPVPPSLHEFYITAADWNHLQAFTTSTLPLKDIFRKLTTPAISPATPEAHIGCILYYITLVSF